MVIGIRQRIVEDTDGSSSQAADLSQDEDDETPTAKRRGPSKEAMEKFTDYSTSWNRAEVHMLMSPQ